MARFGGEAFDRSERCSLPAIGGRTQPFLGDAVGNAWIGADRRVGWAS
jgi:hypothetical protein